MTTDTLAPDAPESAARAVQVTAAADPARAVLFLDGFRAAPGWMTLVTVMLVLGSVASTCYPLGYRLLVDGALDGSTAHVVGGVVIVAD